MMEKRSFEKLLRSAICGVPEAVCDILEMYKPLVDHHCRVYGVIDEDCRQYILLRVVLYIPRFRI